MNEWLRLFIKRTSDFAVEIVLAEMDFRRKVNVASALVNESVSDEMMRRRVTDLLNSVHGLYGDRNKFVHGMWTIGSARDKRNLVRMTAQKTLKITFDEIEAAEIHRLADGFHEACTELTALYRRHISAHSVESAT